MDPSVTVVIPCFNQGQFLQECLASLHAQTRTDWCAIVLDDASTDGVTPALCDAVAGPKVRVVHLPVNHGMDVVRNAGIALATTEAIQNLDADDALLPDTLERTLPLLFGDPRVGIVYFDCDRFGVRTGRMRGERFDEARLYRIQIIFGGSLYRRSAWASTRGYCPDFRIGNGDYDFWLTLVEAGYRGVYVPEPFYRYRCHAASWTGLAGGKGDDRLFRSRLQLVEHHRAGFDRHGATAAFLRETYRTEAQRLQARGDAPGAKALWRKVVSVSPWDLAARLRAL